MKINVGDLAAINAILSSNDEAYEWLNRADDITHILKKYIIDDIGNVVMDKDFYMSIKNHTPLSLYIYKRTNDENALYNISVLFHNIGMQLAEVPASKLISKCH